ncbi:reverse transcriptase domain-containing protein [Tanacetum coccineum]
MPNNIKTYDESDDPEDHLKIFQAAAKVERWATPTWCHMFNSTLTGSARVWFDDLPPESLDSYDDLKKAFRDNFLQQNNCIKDLVEIHHIKQKEGESIEDFMQRVKAKSRKLGENKILKEGEISRINKDQSGDLTSSYSLTNSPKEISALNKGKFKTPPPMTTPIGKRNNKFCEFHGEVGHNTDECMHLRRQIEELIKAGKLLHMINELKQGSGKDQPKA